MTIKQLRAAVYRSQIDMPTLEVWLERMRHIDAFTTDFKPGLANAYNGIYCGSAGEIRKPITTDRHGRPSHYLIMQWYNCRVETAYVS